MFLPRHVIIPSSCDIDGFPTLFCAAQEMVQMDDKHKLSEARIKWAVSDGNIVAKPESHD
jgi:hypothetical protein